jgi:hypothetical protein
VRFRCCSILSMSTFGGALCPARKALIEMQGKAPLQRHTARASDTTLFESQSAVISGERDGNSLFGKVFRARRPDQRGPGDWHLIVGLP